VIHNAARGRSRGARHPGSIPKSADGSRKKVDVTFFVSQELALRRP
jgi:hypothetical protein